MKTPYESKTILVIDDEPFHMVWMHDYIESLGYNVEQCTNLNDGLNELVKTRYRAAIIDLNIPALEPINQQLKKKGGVYSRYPGLFAASFARNKGYRNRQVIIYSVHQDVDVRRETEILGCTYILKGRPNAFQEELEAVLAYDPTTER
jgi:CheY-like chemotaxis protein